jgi:hypothetical protein
MTEPTTIRDALEAAVPAEETNDSFAPEPASEPVIEADFSPEPVAAEEPAPEVQKSEKRDEKGRFKPKDAKPEVAPQATAEAATEPTQGIQPGPKAEPKAAPQERAPASWRPDVREHWSKLPPEVRAEVARREREMQSTLQETAEARRFTEQLQNVIRPYEMFIKAENSNPLQAIDNLMSTAAKLRTGTAPELAQLVAGMVKQFGVGRFGQGFIESLDSALAGEVPRVDPVQNQVQQALQQQLAPVQQFMSQFQQAQAVQQQRMQQEAVGEVQTFLERAEFGEDVREEMADILEVAQRRGRELSLQDAYKQACLVNPRVRAVLEQRAKTRGAQQLTGAAQKARSAAVSVSGAPTLSGPKSDPTDVRSAIEAAIAANAR